ncbi:MAG TPA: carbon-nitrogen hydrolase family protein [Gemmataceae bacterium]|nr:carbon-nitrogen hydrolase family protein [Gemmataceae bacterium]
MSLWKIAAVQIDCRLGDVPFNLRTIRAGLRDAARLGARLAVFPECALTGYCFESRDEAMPFAEAAPGPSIDAVAADCRELGIWAVVGMLERGETGGLFNACALIGPAGFVAAYRKIHLPFLGVDRFTTPGDRPFAVHDLGGLRVGMNICYDGSFPESARVLTVLGADLVALPTNWPTGAAPTIRHLTAARALENHVYYAACNRIGEERGFRFIGQSRIIDCNGDLLAAAGAEAPEIVTAEIDPGAARNKRLIIVPGKYELDRVAHRRPEMYGPLTAPVRPGQDAGSGPSI